MTSVEGERTIAFEAQGAGATVTVSEPSLLGLVVEQLPLGATAREPAASDRRFELVIADDGYAVIEEGDVLRSTQSLATALAVLSDHLFLHVLHRAPELLFVHAGVVGIDGRAIVLPGGARIGKSTLVAALVKAGAAFYTDDYIPIDARGYVHAYPLPIWLVDESGRSTTLPVESIGGRVGEEPLPVGIVAHVRHTPGAAFRLDRRAAAQGTLMLLDNAFGVSLRPGLALTAAGHAAAGALVLEGQRGEADSAAGALLEIASEPLNRSRHEQP